MAIYWNKRETTEKLENIEKQLKEDEVKRISDLGLKSQELLDKAALIDEEIKDLLKIG